MGVMVFTVAMGNQTFGDDFGKKEEVGDSLGDREAFETRAIEDTESLEDEDMGEMWEEITIE